MDNATVPQVFAAINLVAKDLSKIGILKDQKTDKGVKFRGIDQVLNSLAGPLCEHGLRIITKDIEATPSQRDTKSGGVLYHYAIKVTYEIVCVTDGSSTTAVSYGEAFDSGDKALGKAQSYAFKSLVFATFCVPTFPEKDADPDHVDSPDTEQPDAKRPIEQPKAKEPAAAASAEQRGTDANDTAAASAPAPASAPASTAEPASKGLLSMVQKAMAAKGDAGSDYAKGRLKKLGASKWSDLGKTDAAELLADLKAL